MENKLFRIFLIISVVCLEFSSSRVVRPTKNNRNERLSVVEFDEFVERDEQEPGTYSFGYDIDDPETNNIQTRSEERFANGTVVGSYGYLQPDGNILLVNYVADENGYRATAETIPRGTLKVRSKVNQKPQSVAKKEYSQNNPHVINGPPEINTKYTTPYIPPNYLGAYNFDNYNPYSFYSPVRYFYSF